MNIITCGDPQTIKRYSNEAVSVIEDYAFKILRKHINKIKTIKIIFHKEKYYRWSEAFYNLVQGDTITLRIASGFKCRIKWLIVHDLKHVEQILSNKLTIHAPTYKKKKFFNQHVKYNDSTYDLYSVTIYRNNNYIVTDAPWDVQANKTCRKYRALW